MFEKEAKERARDYTENKERQIAYECGFLDGAGRATKELKEDNKVMSDNYSKMEQKFYDNLSEAKVIIKLLLWDLRNRSYQSVEDIEQAEQFLEEIKENE